MCKYNRTQLRCVGMHCTAQHTSAASTPAVKLHIHWRLTKLHTQLSLEDGTDLFTWCMRLLFQHSKGYSLVMKLSSSDAHSCMHSLASLDIFPPCGMSIFISRPTLAMGRNRSCQQQRHGYHCTCVLCYSTHVCNDSTGLNSRESVN